MTYFKYVLVLVLVTFSLSIVSSQSDTRMEFFPASSGYSAMVNIYSSSDGTLEQYYVEDGSWTLNKNVGTPEITINGANYRFQYTPETSEVMADLFVYSVESGEFQFFSLKGNEWMENSLMLKGKASINSKNIRMDYSPAVGNSSAFITAYSIDGNQMSVMHLVDGAWSHIEYFPKMIK